MTGDVSAHRTAAASAVPESGSARPRRALQVVATAWAMPGQVRPIAEALVRRGWEVDVACPSGPETDALRGSGISHLPLSLSRRFLSSSHLRSLIGLVRMLRSRRYSVVHLHGPIPAVLGRVAAALTGTPVIYHCRGTYYEAGHVLLSERLVRLVYPLVERTLARFTTWTFTLNTTDQANLIRRAKFRAESVTCLGVGGCGLDLDRWNPSRYPPERRAEVRRALGVPADRPVIGFVGRIVRLKGVHELVEAFANVRRAGFDAHLLVVGDTPASERDQSTQHEVRERIRAHRLEEHVTFTGHIRNPVDAISVMDILVLPSYWESFGQVLVEAGALGLPVVAAASVGTREAVLDGKTGLLVPKRDVAALTKAVLRLLRDPEQARRMGAEGARRARESLGRERVIGRMLEVYDRVDSANSEVE